MVCIKLISSFLLITLVSGFQTKLKAQRLYTHPLKTKQAVENIRFISRDSRFTYFQKNSGELSLSANFSTRPVFKDSSNTQYLVSGSNARQKLIVTKDQNFYSFFSPQKMLDIYVISFGGRDATFVGKGRYPKLHLNDTWISYYSSDNQVLHFKELVADKRAYKVALTAPAQAFHMPFVEMINDRLFVYTDLTPEFIPQTKTYYPQTKQSEIIYQSLNNGQKHNLCRLGDSLIVSDFSKTLIDPVSSIMRVSIQGSPTLKNLKAIYTSDQADLGNIHCLDNKVFFFKQRNNQERLMPLYDLYSIDLSTLMLKQHSYNQNLSQVFDMDGRLMSILSGEFVELLPTAPKAVQKYQGSSKGAL